MEEEKKIAELPKLSFKERWEQKDVLCEHCGAVIYQQRGLTKQNLKKLFSLKMSLNDYITFFIILMVLFSAWAYNRDIAVCRELIKQDQKYFAMNPMITNANYSAPTLKMFDVGTSSGDNLSNG